MGWDDGIIVCDDESFRSGEYSTRWPRDGEELLSGGTSVRCLLGEPRKLRSNGRVLIVTGDDNLASSNRGGATVPCVERFIDVFTPNDDNIARGDGRLAGDETNSRYMTRAGVCGGGAWSKLGVGTAGIAAGCGLGGVCARVSWLPGTDEGTKGSRSVSTVGYFAYA